MPNPLHTLLLVLALTLTSGLAPALAQDAPPEDEPDGSSQQAEESDEAYRRRMELEDARSRDPDYAPPSGTSGKGLEMIDKLPEASRDNIRGQLVDVIVENGEWEPFDALREYPYEPTAAAKAEPELLKKEQEAWDEQIQKYHAREAAAFGAARGPAPGPGGQAGQEGAEQEGAGQEGGEQGAGEQGGESGAGEQGGGEAGSEGQGGKGGASGTYQPYEPNRSPAEEGVSTAGTQQSALDFLRGQQGQGQAPADPSADPSATQAPDASATQAPDASATQAPESSADSSATEAATEAAAESESESEPAAEAATEIIIDTRGTIAIEDLDKLEGAGPPPESPESDQPRL